MHDMITRDLDIVSCIICSYDVTGVDLRFRPISKELESSMYNNSVHIILVNLKKVKKVKVQKKLYVRTFQSKQCLVENILVKFQKHSSRSRNGNYGQN